jgi:predicted CXXCH cytochrome family protein
VRFAALAVLLVACRAPQPAAPGARPQLQSNILRADYAGSDSCRDCHAPIWNAWANSPMHKMTRLPQAAQIRAPFATRPTFKFKNDELSLDEVGGERFMHVRSSKYGEHTYKVTRVIGGRYREDYAGVEVARPGGAVIGDPTAELILPGTFVFASQSFRLKGYSVMVTEREGLRAGGVWNKTCLFCHNTNPYFDSLFGAIAPGSPAYQGEVVDPLLPAEKRIAVQITDPNGLQAALDAEMKHIGAPPVKNVVEAIKATRSYFKGEHLAEVGIGCESCHGGSAEHVHDLAVRPSFEPRAAFLRVAAGRPVERAEWINRTCARCHQVLFSRYPFTWEGGRRQRDPGGSTINSGEARDFLLGGGCGQKMACTVCHDPHGEDSREKLAALATPAGNPVCTKCHDKYAQPEALRAHAHHDPAGAGASCVGCHMPRKNMGLGYSLSRYHRIGSPTDRARVEGDRPLECAICHTDWNVDKIVADMERLWGKSYDREKLRRLYGFELAVPALRTTVVRGLAHEQGTALTILGEKRDAASLPQVTHELLNPYPLVRYFARAAVENITGQKCDVDLDADDDSIRMQADAWLARVSAQGCAPTYAPH